MRAVVTNTWSQLLPECQAPVSTATLLMVPTTRVPATGVNGHALVDRVGVYECCNNVSCGGWSACVVASCTFGLFDVAGSV